MRRSMTSLVVAALALGLAAAPAQAAKPTLKSLKRDLDRLRGDLTKTRAELATLRRDHGALLIAHNQLVGAHNTLFGCLERSSISESAGFLFSTDNNLSAELNVFGAFLSSPANPNVPLADNTGQLWAVGVKNNATCMSFFGYRLLHPAGFAAASERPQEATGGRH
jgi:hypothetical protein